MTNEKKRKFRYFTKKLKNFSTLLLNHDYYVIIKEKSKKVKNG